MTYKILGVDRMSYWTTQSSLCIELKFRSNTLKITKDLFRFILTIIKTGSMVAWWYSLEIHCSHN